MKLKLIFVGKTEEKYLKQGIDIYLKRLQHYIKTEVVVIPELKNTKSLSEAQQKEKEGELILNQVENSGTLVLMDEKGEDFTSMQWSKYLNKKMVSGTKTLHLVIGGPYGFSDAIYQKANHKISLSKMTFSHQMVRLFLVEQCYRGMTILKNEPYHHE